jgi:hypothetical protein
LRVSINSAPDFTDGGGSQFVSWAAFFCSVFVAARFPEPLDGLAHPGLGHVDHGGHCRLAVAFLAEVSLSPSIATNDEQRATFPEFCDYFFDRFKLSI